MAVTAIHRAEAAQFFSPWVAAEADGRPEAVDPADSAAEAGVLVEAGQVRAGSEMRTKEFLSKLEHDRIVGAIREAESKTLGQIRVYIQRGKVDVDPLIAAQKQFHRLGMHKTPERNAVLIFVAPRAHKFAVVGDQAVHEKCGEQFWQRLIDGMRSHFQNEKFSHAIVETIEETGKMLATHFPKRSSGRNELPDEIVER